MSTLPNGKPFSEDFESKWELKKSMWISAFVAGGILWILFILGIIIEGFILNKEHVLNVLSIR